MSDERFMSLALGLARRGLGRTWPNPSVGCVIVKNGLIIGRGVTQDGGRPHAEVVALRQAGAQAQGATAYVTLEPCAHTGKTPPCASALIDEGVERVVSAMTDSDPRVGGQGHAMLRAAGIEVTTGVCAVQARQANLGFFLRIESQRPMVTLKLANSFDGRIATATGESQWITGPSARRLVHAQRANHDAVMVGAGTARADDPSLTVRGMGIAHQPVRVICSRRLDIPLNSKLAHSAREVPLWLLHGNDVDPMQVQTWEAIGALCIEVSGGANRELDPLSILKALADRGITRVFCEGGGSLAASLLGADVVDILVGFTAGVALGAEGRPSLGAMGVERLARAPRFALQSTRAVGEDIMHIWHRRPA